MQRDEIVALYQPVLATKNRGTVRVPDLRGLPLDQAVKALKERRLTHVLSRDEASGIASGIIDEQFPSPGADLGIGTTIYLRVADAAQPKRDPKPGVP
jgi:beta-lactam-binding protein with PASTA domain